MKKHHYKLNKRGKIQLILLIFIVFALGMIQVNRTIPKPVSVVTTIVYAEDIIEENIVNDTLYDTFENTSSELIAEPEIPEVIEPVKQYDDATVEVLTNLLYGEARGIKSDAQKAAVIWCVLNRYDNGHYGDTIIKVATAKHQFCGYVAGRTYEDMTSYEHCKNIVTDVLDRYYTEDQIGRTLPKDYLYFVAKNGANVFTQKWQGTNYWNWSLPDPYI